MKGSGVSGFICLVELQIVHLERNRVTGYWILADMRYCYGRACTVASSGTPLHTTYRLVIEIQCWIINITIGLMKLSLALHILQTFLPLTLVSGSDRMPNYLYSHLDPVLLASINEAT